MVKVGCFVNVLSSTPRSQTVEFFLNWLNEITKMGNGAIFFQIFKQMVMMATYWLLNLA